MQLAERMLELLNLEDRARVTVKAAGGSHGVPQGLTGTHMIENKEAEMPEIPEVNGAWGCSAASNQELVENLHSAGVTPTLTLTLTPSLSIYILPFLCVLVGPVPTRT